MPGVNSWMRGDSIGGGTYSTYCAIGVKPLLFLRELAGDGCCGGGVGRALLGCGDGHAEVLEGRMASAGLAGAAAPGDGASARAVPFGLAALAASADVRALDCGDFLVFVGDFALEEPPILLPGVWQDGSRLRFAEKLAVASLWAPMKLE